MDEATARTLNALNQRFYRDAAEEFHATRQTPWPGFARLAEELERHACPWLLDLGCGNGRFAAFLDARRSRPFRYTGLDASAALLEHARRLPLRLARPQWTRADFVREAPQRVLPEGRFDAVLLLGVLHHVPGADRRRALLRAAARRLRPGGLLAVSVWQLGARERFARRLEPWARVAIDPAQLEAGDLLLRWGARGSPRLRYCHFADAAETRSWTRCLGLEQVASYLSDGREGDLNRYLLLRRGKAGPDAPRPGGG